MAQVDLVLSGSGIRFYAFWGAVLELKKKHKFIRLAGTSGGAIISGLTCLMLNGIKTQSQISAILHSMDPKCYVDPNFFFWNGWSLYKGNKFKKVLHEVFEDLTFSDLPQLHVVVTNLSKQESHVLSAKTHPDEKVYKWIYASSAVPFIFRPLKYKGDLYVDGLVTINFALDYFSDHRRKTIGLKVVSSSKPKPNLKTLSGRIRSVVETFRMSAEREHIEDAYWANVIYIDTGNVRSLDFFDINEIKDDLIKKGQIAVQEYFEKTKRTASNRRKKQ